MFLHFSILFDTIATRFLLKITLEGKVDYVYNSKGEQMGAYRVTDMASDSEGNLYITQQGVGLYSYSLIKLNPKDWSAYNRIYVGSNEYFNAVTLDGRDNVYVLNGSDIEKIKPKEGKIDEDRLEVKSTGLGRIDVKTPEDCSIAVEC